jgi:hypothetical protein
VAKGVFDWLFHADVEDAVHGNHTGGPLKGVWAE